MKRRHLAREDSAPPPKHEKLTPGQSILELLNTSRKPLSFDLQNDAVSTEFVLDDSFDRFCEAEKIVSLPLSPRTDRSIGPRVSFAMEEEEEDHRVQSLLQQIERAQDKTLEQLDQQLRQTVAEVNKKKEEQLRLQRLRAEEEARARQRQLEAQQAAKEAAEKQAQATAKQAAEPAKAKLPTIAAVAPKHTQLPSPAEGGATAASVNQFHQGLCAPCVETSVTCSSVCSHSPTGSELQRERR